MRSQGSRVLLHNILFKSATTKKVVIFKVSNRFVTLFLFIQRLVNVEICLIFRHTGFSATQGRTLVNLKVILQRKNRNPCDFVGLSRHTGSLCTQGGTLFKYIAEIPIKEMLPSKPRGKYYVTLSTDY